MCSCFGRLYRVVTAGHSGVPPMEEEIITRERDKITQLPEHVKDEILGLLPIKELVRTSILSRNWRDKWQSVPRLEFDDRCTRAVRTPGTLCQRKLVKIIDRVLLLHTGPIQTFKLSHTKFLPTSDIDPWILHLSRVSIKRIVLYIYTGHKYKVPSSFFNCRDLVCLKLRRCSVKIPSSFEGFKKLTTLYLRRVELSPCGLEAMISRCPSLKHLNLRNLEGITRVNLEAAHNLRSLVIGGAFLEVTVGVANRLTWVAEGFDHNIGHGNASSTNLPKFFRGIPNIKILKVERYSLKYLAGNFPQYLPHVPLVHLKHLFTCIDFNSKEEVLTVMNLIRKSPRLKKVEFQCRPKNQQTVGIETMGDFWKDHHSCCLEQIQVVSMDNIYGTDTEKEFMKFLLISLPNLQTMTIRPGSRMAEGTSLKDLLQFGRASKQAKVIFL